MRLALAPLLLCACVDTGLGRVDVDGAPGARVSPVAVDFGPVRRGDAVTGTVAIRSTGTGDLVVRGLSVRGDPAFSIDARDAFVLPPGAEERVPVRFSPTAPFDAAALLEVATEDPVRPVWRVGLAGSGAAPHARLSPATWGLGPVDVGCEARAAFTLENLGDDDLVLTALDGLDPALDATTTLRLPRVVAPGGAVPVEIAWAPTAPGALDAALVARTDDPRGDPSARLTGAAAYARVVTEAWTAPDDPPLDLLFAVDQSTSMDARSVQLAANFDLLVEGLERATADWRIGVASLQSGCFAGGILDRDRAVGAFAAAVVAGDDPGGAWSEGLLELTLRALDRAELGCNEGFLRPGARLHVVLISDERDQSTPPISPAAFLAAARAHLDAPEQLAVSGVLCPDPRCPDGSADGSAEGYAPVVGTGGGVRLDILTADWGDAAAALAGASVDPYRRFPLTDGPVHAPSLEITVDGARVSGLIDGDQLVLDAPAAPGARVEARYGVLGCR